MMMKMVTIGTIPPDMTIKQAELKPKPRQGRGDPAGYIKKSRKEPLINHLKSPTGDKEIMKTPAKVKNEKLGQDKIVNVKLPKKLTKNQANHPPKPDKKMSQETVKKDQEAKDVKKVNSLAITECYFGSEAMTFDTRLSELPVDSEFKTVGGDPIVFGDIGFMPIVSGLNTLDGKPIYYRVFGDTGFYLVHEPICNTYTITRPKPFFSYGQFFTMTFKNVEDIQNIFDIFYAGYRHGKDWGKKAVNAKLPQNLTKDQAAKLPNLLTGDKKLSKDSVKNLKTKPQEPSDAKNANSLGITECYFGSEARTFHTKLSEEAIDSGLRTLGGDPIYYRVFGETGFYLVHESTLNTYTITRPTPYFSHGQFFTMTLKNVENIQTLFDIFYAGYVHGKDWGKIELKNEESDRVCWDSVRSGNLFA